MKSFKAILGVAMLATIVPAQAAVTFYFNDPKAIGDPIPGGTPSFATLVISDSAVNTVTMTLSHSSTSAAGQFISNLKLNMSPYPASPSASYSSSKINGITFGSNNFTDSGSTFDMNVDFKTSNSNNGANRLKPGESVSWTVTGTGLDELDFMSLSGGTARYGLLHMQGIAGGLSSKLVADPVPEPASMAALAIGVAGLLRKRTRKS